MVKENIIKEVIPIKEHILSVIESNDKRYTEHFSNLEKLVDLGSTDQKEAVSAAFKAQQEAVNAALAAAKEAVNKAETAAEKRFASVNEFRSTLSDQQKNLLPRIEAETKFEYYTKSIDKLYNEIAILREYKSAGKGKEEGIKDVWGIIAGVVGICIAMCALLLGFFGA